MGRINRRTRTFSLVASKRLGSAHESHCTPIPSSEEKVLRAAVLYGANGAGKSNLLEALRYAKRIALRTRKKSRGTGRNPFRFADMRHQSSTFDIQFIAEEKLYRFGFSVDDERIIEEWLIVIVGNREKAIYERSTDADGRVDIEAPGLEDGGEKLSALVTVGDSEFTWRVFSRRLQLQKIRKRISKVRSHGSRQSQSRQKRDFQG